MPPKASRNGHDDSKSETPNSKEKNGHAASNSVSNGKMRRVASSAGSNLREVTNAPIVTLSAAVAEVSVQEHINPGVSFLWRPVFFPKPTQPALFLYIVKLSRLPSRRFNGPLSTEKSSTPTDECTASPPRPRSPGNTTIGCSPSAAASGCTLRR